MHVAGCGEKRELAFVKYMDMAPPRDNEGRALECVSLQWCTEEGIDNTLAQGDQSFGVHEPKNEQRLGFEPFCSIKSTIRVMCENFAVAPFSEYVPWPLGRFNIYRFYEA